MYEIIANPSDYDIDAIKEGMGYKPVAFPDDERQKWVAEIGIFAEGLYELAGKAKDLQDLFNSEATIMATPASMKIFKLQLFKINDAIKAALDLAQKLESEIIET